MKISEFYRGHQEGRHFERYQRQLQSITLFKILFVPVFLAGIGIAIGLYELWDFTQKKIAKQAVVQYREHQLGLEKAVEAVRKDSPVYTGYETETLPNKENK